MSDCGLRDKEDTEIWTYAQNNDYTIVTFDSDFYDISLINGHPPKIIWLRTGNLTKNDIVKLLIEKEKQIKDFIEADSFRNVSCFEVE